MSEEQSAGQSFDVFLCHNSDDKPAVKQIAERLLAKGVRPWLDEWELRPGLPWQRLLEEQIASIASAAVFVGDSGFGPWQELEQEAFLRQFTNRQCPVIPVILPDCKETPGLPVFLAGMTWVDFRKDAPDPISQLVWGITGRTKKVATASVMKPEDYGLRRSEKELSQKLLFSLLPWSRWEFLEPFTVPAGKQSAAEVSQGITDAICSVEADGNCVIKEVRQLAESFAELSTYDDDHDVDDFRNQGDFIFGQITECMDRL